MKQILKCGCAPVAINLENDKPCCVIHGCEEFADIQPDLTDRLASCAYCGKQRPSNPNLAFFEHKLGLTEDVWYCGCHGWD